MMGADSIPAGELIAQLQGDPYRLYAQLRAAGRVLWSEQLGRWMVSGHPEALAVLKDSRMSSDPTRADGRPSASDLPPLSMLFLDPPDHTRLRTLVLRAFTPRVVEGLRARVQELVDHALDRACDRGGLDLIADLASPLPATVIAELLGVPAEEHEVIKDLSIAGSLDPIALDQAPPIAARRELDLYLTAAIDRRRQQPRDDLISRLIDAEERGDRLDAGELVRMCVLLLVAGHETTVNLIGNGVNALLDHPDQLARLRAHPELLDAAVEEMLRFDSPVQTAGRVVTEPLELGGRSLPRGQEVLVLLGAANRDPAVFPDPGRLDVSRTPNPHLSFARGIHFCLGAPLARLEGQVAIGSLVRRFPRLERAGAPQRRPAITFRGFASLPVGV
jgi:pimeloyl-[acyl-carrier protein] synthase